MNKTINLMFNNLEYNSLDKNYFKLMLVKRVIFVLIVIVILFVYRLINSHGWLSSTLFIIGIGVVFLLGLFYVLLAKVYFARKQYAINESNVTYKSGVLFQSIVVVPFSRIQHIELDEGPFERKLGLTALSIYTAGDSGKDLLIKGLKNEKAIEIKEYITSYIKNE